MDQIHCPIDPSYIGSPRLSFSLAFAARCIISPSVSGSAHEYKNKRGLVQVYVSEVGTNGTRRYLVSGICGYAMVFDHRGQETSSEARDSERRR